MASHSRRLKSWVLRERRSPDSWAVESLLGPPEKKEALNLGGNAYMDLFSVRQEVERTMAISLDANPNHGLDNRGHEVVGAVFGGRLQRNLEMQSVTLNPRKSYESAVMGRQEMGGLDRRRLIVHKWLVRSYEEGQRCDPPHIAKA